MRTCTYRPSCTGRPCRTHTALTWGLLLEYEHHNIYNLFTSTSSLKLIKHATKLKITSDVSYIHPLSHSNVPSEIQQQNDLIHNSRCFYTACYSRYVKSVCKAMYIFTHPVCKAPPVVCLSVKPRTFYPLHMLKPQTYEIWHDNLLQFSC